MIAISERLNELIIEKQVDNLKLATALKVNVTAVQRWRRNATKLYLQNALAICDFFGCSLEFLTGRTETKLDFSPKTSDKSFYEHVRETMLARNITRYRMTKESKFKESYFQAWSKGSLPQIPTLIELADYLGVTLDELAGRECGC